MHPRIASQSNNFDWPGGLCPSRSCVSCEVIYCSLELDARFRCRTFPRFLPTPVTKRYFHLSIFLLLFFSFSLSLSLFLLLLLLSIFLALFALADNKIPAADRDGKENIFWRGKLSRTRHRENTSKHSSRGEERRGRWNEERGEEFSLVMQQRRNLHTAKYIIKRSTSSFSSSFQKMCQIFAFYLSGQRRYRDIQSRIKCTLL